MQPFQQVCPFYHKAVELIGKRWNGAIIRTLLTGPKRFSEILDAVPGLSDRLLSARLKELEAEGLLERQVYPETPVRIEYALTRKGRDLERVIAELQQWADQWLAKGMAPAPRSSKGQRGRP